MDEQLRQGALLLDSGVGQDESQLRWLNVVELGFFWLNDP